MTNLFTAELEPWQRAKDSGMTLADHIIQVTLKTLHSVEEIELRTTRPKLRRWSRNRIAVAITVAITLFVAAYCFTRWVMVEPASLKVGPGSG